MSDPIATLREALADRYAIRRELGAGGMATVYLAEDLKHRRQVAVKVLRPELAAVLGPDRFLREIEIAARLQHPHILPLFDSGLASGFLYYVMPYVEGESLRGRLVREGALPIAEAARILRDVADALAHAHARGVVHRDIKPENVMLSGRHALVTDFGVAKAVSEASGRQQLTTAGVALGTPAYMAPEQAAADPNMDHRVDVYALGVVAYELLTGRPPFEGGTPQETLAAHVTKAPQPVSTHRSTVPPALAQLVMKCLEKRPADRCQKADEMVGQLEGFTTPSGGVTPTGTRPLDVMRSPRLRRVAVAAVAVITIGVAWMWTGRGSMARVGTTDQGDTVRLAVLPFENQGRSQDQFFADGVTDAIRNEIQRVPGLFVIGRQTSMRYKDTKLSPTEVGEALGVAYLLTGTIQWDGESKRSSRIRIKPELIRVSDQTVRWQESYDRTYEDIFAVQTDIASRAGDGLSSLFRTSGTSLPVQTVAAPSPARLEAYTLYLKGMDEIRRFTQAGYSQAVEYFGRAVQKDSMYAEGWAALADAIGRSEGDAAEARAAALHALRLDPFSARAYEGLGNAAWVLEWDFAAAEKAFRQAARLDPNDVAIMGPYSVFLTAIGKYEEALQVGRRAAELDPLWAGDVPLYALLGLGKYEEVVNEARAGLALDTADSPGGYYGNMGEALLQLGRFEEALDAYEQTRVRKNNPKWRFGFAHARAGDERYARQLLREALEAATHAQTRAGKAAAQFAAAAIYANLNQPDSAFLWLERTVPLRGRFLTEVRWRAAVAPLRGEPQFKELLRKIGLEK